MCRLLIDYVGDSARLYFGSRLLTDNWQSGYSGKDGGGMEVGLNYLAGENPGLLEKGAQLQLWVSKNGSLCRILFLFAPFILKK
jgi:hypothetical protein